MKIGIIGCGNMGGGLAQCLSAKNSVLLYDTTRKKAEELQSKGYGKACQSLDELLKLSDIVILVVKPQGFKVAAEQCRKKLRKEQMLISLLTGVSISRVKDEFAHEKVVRMMPNLALIYGDGVIALATEPPSPTKNGKD